MSTFTELRSSRDLIFNLTLREIRGKYKRTALGQIWSLVNPLAQMAIFSLVFGFVLTNPTPPGDPSGLDTFALWLSAVLLPWIFFANVITTGMGSIIGNSNLVMKVYFRRDALVISTVLSWLFTFGIEMSVLLVVVTIFGGEPWLFLPLIALTMLLLAALGMGIAFMLAVANVYFRDTQHFVSIAIQMWFYATPIVYPVTLIEAKDQAHPGLHLLTLYQINPMERFAEVFRNLIYDNRLPSLGASVYVAVVPLVVLAAGYAIFQRFEGRLAEEL